MALIHDIINDQRSSPGCPRTPENVDLRRLTASCTSRRSAVWLQRVPHLPTAHPCRTNTGRRTRHHPQRFCRCAKHRTTDLDDELNYLVTAFGIRVPRKLVLFGDINCPETNGSHVDDDLASLLDTFCLCQHVCEPTRGANLLDILASEDVSSVSSLVIDDAGLISDHRLIIASVRLCLPARCATPYTFHGIKNVNHQQFEQALYSSELFTAPTSTVGAFTEQLVFVVTTKLDLVAPVQTRKKHRHKASSKWLSLEAIRAKHLRRRRERRWKTSGLDTDRTTYRAACRMANKAINESQRSQHSQRISECVDSKQRWATIKNILHSYTGVTQTTRIQRMRT